VVPFSATCRPQESRRFKPSRQFPPRALHRVRRVSVPIARTSTRDGARRHRGRRLARDRQPAHGRRCRARPRGGKALRALGTWKRTTSGSRARSWRTRAWGRWERPGSVKRRGICRAVVRLMSTAFPRPRLRAPPPTRARANRASRRSCLSPTLTSPFTLNSLFHSSSGAA